MNEKHSITKQKVWKPNVNYDEELAEHGPQTTCSNWRYGVGIELPLSENEWQTKDYVWFEAVQGYLTCSQIWSERFSDNPDD